MKSRGYSLHKANGFGHFRDEPEDTFATHDLALLKAKKWAKEDRVVYQLRREGEHFATVFTDGEVYYADPKKGPRQ